MIGRTYLERGAPVPKIERYLGGPHAAWLYGRGLDASSADPDVEVTGRGK